MRAAFRSYGANLGIAFQLIDDALDYGGQTPTLGKDVGDDFREGKVTLPVVLAYRRGTAADREFWKRTLVKGAIGDDDLAAGGIAARPHARAEGHGRARPPLRRHGARRAGAAARRAVQGGAAAGGGVLHRPRALT